MQILSTANIIKNFASNLINLIIYVPFLASKKKKKTKIYHIPFLGSFLYTLLHECAAKYIKP